MPVKRKFDKDAEFISYFSDVHILLTIFATKSFSVKFSGLKKAFLSLVVNKFANAFSAHQYWIYVVSGLAENRI